MSPFDHVAGPPPGRPPDRPPDRPSTPPPAAPAGTTWPDAVTIAALLAVDPAGLGGAIVRAPAGPVRDRWLELLRTALPADTPFRRIPPSIGDDRLLGGLDLAATLAAGRPVAMRGVLADCDGGLVVLAMAERMTAATAARIAAVLDTGQTHGPRDGLANDNTASIGLVALDEGVEPDERVPAILVERMALRADLSAIRPRDAIGGTAGPGPQAIAAARALLPDTRANAETVGALCAAGVALGIVSIRPTLFAVRVARAAAALAGRREVTAEDATLAARLVLGPRARQMPAPPQDSAAEQPPAAQPEPPAGETDDTPDDDAEQSDGGRDLPDVVLAAAAAAIPANVLARFEALRASARARTGRSGARKAAVARGRPVGVRPADLRTPGRLALVDTLRAAAPWQPIRRRTATTHHRIHIQGSDLRERRFEERSETTTIFVVDASGSSALNRLAEAKGAVELLLAESYTRRDQVAVIAFRGFEATLLLPPTRALARAKRSLAGLPGGGGTPLASALDAALALAVCVRARGATPSIVVLTDGRANVARDGSGGRPRAEADALQAARSVRAAGLSTVLIDTSPKPHPSGKGIAAAMGGRYLPLPYADSAALSRAVRAARVMT